MQVGQRVDQCFGCARKSRGARVGRVCRKGFPQGGPGEVIGDNIGSACQRPTAHNATVADANDVRVRQTGQPRELGTQARWRGARRQELERASITVRRILRQKHLGFAAIRQSIEHTVAASNESLSPTVDLRSANSIDLSQWN